jgi:hypothetical protein
VRGVSPDLPRGRNRRLASLGSKVRKLLVVLLLVVTSCGSTSAAQVASHKASPSMEPNVVAATCKLPIASSDAPVVPKGPIPIGHGGFMSVPSGVFSADPNSLGAYDAKRSTWLPVTPAGISPDGSRYAWVVDPNTPQGNFPPGTGTVDINNLDGGGYGVNTPSHVRLVAWTPSGIYVASISPQAGASPVGLSLINANSNAFDHQIIAAGSWPVVGYSYAYGADLDRSDPHPPAPSGNGTAPGNRIEKLSLADGTVTPVLTVPGSRVFPVGLDYSYNVIVGANNAGAFTVTLEPSGQQIFSGPSLDTAGGASDPTSAVADLNGIWFSSVAGDIWHYAPGETAVHRVGSTGLTSARIAGTCT